KDRITVVQCDGTVTGAADRRDGQRVAFDVAVVTLQYGAKPCGRGVFADQNDIVHRNWRVVHRRNVDRPRRGVAVEATVIGLVVEADLTVEILRTAEAVGAVRDEGQPGDGVAVAVHRAVHQRVGQVDAIHIGGAHLAGDDGILSAGLATVRR